jgi:hypothetical protein
MLEGDGCVHGRLTLRKAAAPAGAAEVEETFNMPAASSAGTENEIQLPQPEGCRQQREAPLAITENRPTTIGNHHRSQAASAASCS